MGKITKHKNRYRASISIDGKLTTMYFNTIDDAESWHKAKAILNSDQPKHGEKWEEIPGFSRYIASSLGRLLSVNYKNSGIIKEIKPALGKDGYFATMLQGDNKKYYSWKVHKWITLAFLGERKEGQEVNHIDGNKQNNHIDNLEYCTRSENCQHSFDIGIQKPKAGELNGMAKLTNEQVLRARKMKAENGRYWGRNELAKEYGISAKHLQKIVNNYDRSWSNI